MTKYPLTWPAGWKRTPASQRKRAQFKKKRQTGEFERLTIELGTTRILYELDRLCARDPIISANLRLRTNGLPLSNQREPEDPGAAVYWTDRKKRQKTMATDQYDRIADNLAALAATLEAMRAIERHGGAMILDRAFTGFEALPAPNIWWLVLQVKETATLQEARAAYLHLSKVRHPDNGGSDAAMAELNWAWEQSQRELKG